MRGRSYSYRRSCGYRRVYRRRCERGRSYREFVDIK